MKRFLICTAVLACAACVGDGVEFGGVGAETPLPARTVPCSEADLTRAEDGRMFVPDEVSLFFTASQVYQSMNRMHLTYDVNEAGQALNVRYSGPPEYLKHATRQKLIRAASDFLQTSRFAWPSTPAFATGCQFELQFVVDWRRGPDGVTDEVNRKPS